MTQFTSFVAIEKRDKDEVTDVEAPTMEELVEKEDVDQLTYMGFEKVGYYVIMHQSFVITRGVVTVGGEGMNLGGL